jgi:hypothetical protein
MPAADLNAVHLALRARAKPALPTYREFENVPFTAPATDPYSEEDFVPATHTLRSVTAVNGLVIITGIYVIRWFGKAGDGTAAMNTGLTALLARFPTGLTLTASDGTKVAIGSASGPNRGAWRGQITNLDNGRPLSTVTIPWWLTSENTF